MAFEHVVIVGAGHAGGIAAATLKSAGHQGRITLVGEESHPPYERPPLSKELLSGTIELEKTFLRPLQWYEENGISLRLNTRVATIDMHAQRLDLSDGKSVPYDKLLITTGARARRASFWNGDTAPYYVRDINDAMALRARLSSDSHLVVIGGGFIGLEIAATARKFGCRVTVLEMASLPLNRVTPPEIGRHVAELHRRNGVDLRCLCSVEALQIVDGRPILRLTGGEKIEADLVAIGIGAVPNTELAESAGLTLDDGLVVNEFGKTSNEHIFAAGDVTRHFNPLLGRSIRLEAWQNAQNQAIAVAKIMAGGSTAFAEVPWLWTDMYDMNMQMAGAPSEWDELVYRGEPGNGPFMAFQLFRQRVVGCISVDAARDMRFARQLIATAKSADANLLANPNVRLQDICR